MTGTENDGVLAFDDKPQSCRLWAINIELSVETTEFYHSWNRNIVPNSLESLEALTRLCKHLFKTTLFSVCTRIDNQMQSIIFSGR